MVFSLEIFLKEKDVRKVNILELLVEWGGEFLSQDPPKYVYNSTLTFEQFLDIEYYKKYHKKVIENDFDFDEYVAFRLLGGKMLELEKLINTCDEKLKTDVLICYLKEVSKLDTYGMILLREEECIDKRYRINSEKELIDTVCNCLKWDAPEGAFITK